MQRSMERALDRLLLLATLLIGVAIGLLISPRISKRVEAQEQVPAPAANVTTIPLTSYMGGPAIVSNVVLAHELEADHAVVNGYDLLLLDQNIVNYLAKLPIANGMELSSIGDRSRATTRYVLPPPQKPGGNATGGSDGKQPPK